MEYAVQTEYPPTPSIPGQIGTCKSHDGIAGCKGTARAIGGDRRVDSAVPPVEDPGKASPKIVATCVASWAQKTAP